MNYLFTVKNLFSEKILTNAKKGGFVFIQRLWHHQFIRLIFNQKYMQSL